MSIGEYASVGKKHTRYEIVRICGHHISKTLLLAGVVGWDLLGPSLLAPSDIPTTDRGPAGTASTTVTVPNRCYSHVDSRFAHLRSVFPLSKGRLALFDNSSPPLLLLPPLKRRLRRYILYPFSALNVPRNLSTSATSPPPSPTVNSSPRLHIMSRWLWHSPLFYLRTQLYQPHH